MLSDHYKSNSLSRWAHPLDDSPNPDNNIAPQSPVKLSPWRTAASVGWLAAKSNKFPAIAMWLFGIAIVGGYFAVPFFRSFLESVGEFKESCGWKFSVVSTAIFGGLIPSIIPWFLGAGKKNKPSLGLTVASTILWAYKGFEIDMFYHFQAWLFGSEFDFSTVAIKTFCDQIVWVPLIGMVNVVLFFRWRDCGYSLAKMWRTLEPDWYQKRVMPVLIANWVIWIPAVAMIYSLPVALQLPVQNLILCFWVLILMFFTSEPENVGGDGSENGSSRDDAIAFANNP